MEQILPQQVQLFNGAPKICIQKQIDGSYKWATKRTGMMTHTSLKAIIAIITQYGYAYYINEIPKIENED